MLVIYFVHSNVKINVLQASPTYKNSGSSWKIPGARNSPMVVYSPTRDSRADSASIHSASSSRSSSTRYKILNDTPMTTNFDVSMLNFCKKIINLNKTLQNDMIHYE